MVLESKLSLDGYTFIIGNLDSITKSILDNVPKNGSGPLVITPNMSIWGAVQKNQLLNFVKHSTKFHLVDGWPIALALSIKYGRKISRTAGSDLLPKLIESCAKSNFKMAIIGGHPDYELRLEEYCTIRNINLNFKIFDFKVDCEPAELNDLQLEQILHYSPEVIVVCLGFPKQEYIGFQLRHSFKGPILCLGAALDFLIYPKLRAPNLVIKLNLEWLWRFLHEPRRLFKRYYVEALGGFPSLIKAIFE